MRATERLRRKNAEGLVLLLARSGNPLAALRQHKRQINETVVDALIGVCYHHADTGDLDSALMWTELAGEASLLGGTVQTQADVCLCRSTMYWRLAEFLPKDEDLLEMLTGRGREPGDPSVMKPSAQALVHLNTALEWADRALAICAEAGLRAEAPHVRYRRAEIHASAGERIKALEDQIGVVTSWADVPGRPHPPAVDLGNVADRYWNLRAQELQAGAQTLTDQAHALLAAAELWPEGPELADLREALGAAFRRTGQPGEALRYWEHACSLYHRFGASADEYRVRRSMQHVAYLAGGYQRALSLGQACISIARTAGLPENLGDCLHNLAAAYRATGDTQAAIAKYREAAELLAQEPSSVGRADCFLELGLLEMGALETDPGLFEEASRDLEEVLASRGTGFHYWIAHAALAELFLEHMNDLSAAIHHSDKAAEMSISAFHDWTGKPAARAYSFNLSGLAHRAAGEHDIAFSRFRDAIEIISAGAEEYQLTVSSYYRHWVIPPALTQVTEQAFLACQEAGLAEEALYFRDLHLRAAEADPAPGSPETAADDEPGEEIRAFMAGRRLEHADPARAAREFQKTAELAEGEGDTRLQMYAHAMAGRCWLRADNLRPAREHAERSLALTTDADPRVRLTCFDLLGTIALKEGDFAQVHAHISRYVELVERYRASLPTAEERIRFLQGERLSAYEALIYACLRLGKIGEALEVVEMIKARTLADMLSRKQHKPIDYQLAEEAMRLGGAHQDWISEYGRRFSQYDPANDAEFENSEQYRMMAAIIDLHKQQADIHERAQSRNAMERIDAAQERLTIAEIRSLLLP